MTGTDTQVAGTTLSCVAFQGPRAQAPRPLFSVASPHCGECAVHASAQGRSRNKPPGPSHVSVTRLRACVRIPKGAVCHCAPHSTAGAPHPTGTHPFLGAAQPHEAACHRSTERCQHSSICPGVNEHRILAGVQRARLSASLRPRLPAARTLRGPRPGLCTRLNRCQRT